MKPVSVEDYRELARRRLPRLLFEYIDGAALSESAKTRNNADFAGIHLRQRVLTGVEEVSLKTE
ncbi:MAG: alpha-hydroxy-acid oxidizing protein, partial [Caulobacteraceae bacterium]